MTISLLARACFFGGGGGSTGCASSVGAEPSPSHATGAPDAGAQSVPRAQQFASINAAQRNKMDFEIIVIISWRRNQMTKKRDVMLEPFPFGRNKNRAPDLRSDAFSQREPSPPRLKTLWCGWRRTSPTQWPSSARLTQLNANSEPRTAAADANLAIALTDRMTTTFL